MNLSFLLLHLASSTPFLLIKNNPLKTISMPNTDVYRQDYFGSTLLCAATQVSFLVYKHTQRAKQKAEVTHFCLL